MPKANNLSYPVITYAKIKLEEIIVLSSWAESSLLYVNRNPFQVNKKNIFHPRKC